MVPEHSVGGVVSAEGPIKNCRAHAAVTRAHSGVRLGAETFFKSALHVLHIRGAIQRARAEAGQSIPRKVAPMWTIWLRTNDSTDGNCARFGNRFSNMIL